MKLRRYKDGDIQKIDLQDEQKHEIISAKYPENTSFTIEDNGEVLGCFAFLEVCEKRGVVCSFISRNAGRAMLKMVKQFRKLLDDGMEKTGMERIELQVLDGFEHGERFAKMLGFECEGVMRKYYKGRDYKLFARVK
jgi:hypothetical protein